jgi:hypothetical protein
MSPNPTHDQLASSILLAERRNRFRWQAEVSEPGSSGVSVVVPDDFATELLDRLAPESGGSHA